MRRRCSSLLAVLRPRHWIKNGFVLAPLLFCLPAVAARAALDALVAAAAFTLASAAVYAVNDIVDRASDRRHPDRRRRPVAAGEVSPLEAGALAAGCACAAAGLCLLVPWRVGVSIAGYAALNVAYSLLLKRVLLVDVMTIAAGFMLRVLAGAAALGVPVSSWMLLTTFFVALFLGFSKRRSEIADARGRKGRAVLSEYTAPLLDTLIVISVGITIVTYSLYVILAVENRGNASEALVATVPLVAYGLLRYLSLVAVRGAGGDVAEVVLRDVPLLATIAAWLVAVALVLVLAS